MQNDCRLCPMKTKAATILNDCSLAQLSNNHLGIKTQKRGINYQGRNLFHFFYSTNFYIDFGRLIISKNRKYFFQFMNGVSGFLR
jgi:hypothetical protein